MDVSPVRSPATRTFLSPTSMMSYLGKLLVDTLVWHVRVDALALELLDACRDDVKAEVELVVAEADVVELREVQPLCHSAAAVHGRQRTRRQEIAIEVRADDTSQSFRLRLGGVDGGGDARVVVELVAVIDGQNTQEFSDGLAWTRQQLGPCGVGAPVPASAAAAATGSAGIATTLCRAASGAPAVHGRRRIWRPPPVRSGADIARQQFALMAAPAQHRPPSL